MIAGSTSNGGWAGVNFALRTVTKAAMRMLGTREAEDVQGFKSQLHFGLSRIVVSFCGLPRSWALDGIACAR